MNSDKILVCLYSDSNFLALSVLENLLSKNCYVLVVTDEENKWENATIHISSKSRFSIIKPSDVSQVLYFNYIIFFGGFFKKEKAYKSYDTFVKSNNLIAPKTLLLFPFESFSPKEDSLINLSGKLGAVYLGDLLGPRINLESNLLLPSLINRILQKRELKISTGELLYPIFVSDAAKTITKWLFSFGPYGKSIFLVGSQISTSDFLSANQKIVGEIKMIEEKDGERRFVPRNYELKSVSINLNSALYETYKWISSFGRESLPAIRKTKKKKYPKYFKPIVALVLGFLLLPFILIVASFGLFFLSYKDVLAGTGDRAFGKVLVGKTLFTVSEGESRVLKHVPGLGLIYRESEFVSRVGRKASDLIATSVPAIKASSELFNDVLGDKVYDPNPLSQELGGSFDSGYQYVSEIQAEAQTAKNAGVLSARLLLQKIDLDTVALFFQQGKVMADNLPGFLGAGGRKTYLVLFQNNMELRPTGGFIGSFGLLSFDGGRMSDLTVSDVYSADGQLRGHVEPPAPIKNYLNEANWWLRDSNWDPDFPTSAQRAEWFLDKEIDQKVDGVFAIDLNPVRDAVALTGPIFLPDYNLNITSDNLYEKTQAEAQEEFFPGSHQKASFLTALSRNLVGEVEKLGRGKKVDLLYSVFRNFEERHFQAFLHNDQLQGFLSSLGWSGSVQSPSCGDGCYADLVGITEANVGVNKVNYFIQRSVNLEINLGTEGVEHKLSLSLKNTANPALGLAGKYKVYVRIFVPKDAEAITVDRTGGDYKEALNPEISDSHGRKEVGVLTEILGGSSQKIDFHWRVTGALAKNQTYGLYIRKQAGVTDDPWDIAISTANPSLTNQKPYSYNTVLSQDFITKVNWAGRE